MNAFNRTEIQALLINHTASLEQFMATNELLDVILSKRFGVEYLPVIDVQSGEVQGYQASARFWDKRRRTLDARKIFGYLQQNPLLLFHTELELMKLQICEFPAEGWLMLDLHIDSVMEVDITEINPFLDLFKEYAWSDRELIISLVESSHGNDQDRLQEAISILQQSGTALALQEPDISWGMFSLSTLLDARMIKFNGSALKILNQEAAQTTAEWLIDAARRIGVQTIMSGVDDCEQLDWARRMGVDSVQGRLFARQAIQVRNL